MQTYLNLKDEKFEIILKRNINEYWSNDRWETIKTDQPYLKISKLAILEIKKKTKN